MFSRNFIRIVMHISIDRLRGVLNRSNGTLTNHQTVSSSAGAGPRHFAHHPNGRWFYSLNEEASTLAFMSYDAATGTLTPKEETTTLPAGFKGTNFTSEIIINRKGSFIYVLNRLHNSIGIFEVQGNGSPKLIGDVWTRADYPRSCNIDPTGRFLYVCHNKSDNVTTFRAEGESGHLTFTGVLVIWGRLGKPPHLLKCLDAVEQEPGHMKEPLVSAAFGLVGWISLPVAVSVPFPVLPVGEMRERIVIQA